jgi:hypothetical protein
MPDPTGRPEQHEWVERKACEASQDQNDAQLLETIDYGHSGILLGLANVEAIQRTHISLIDRRHRSARRVPYRAYRRNAAMLEEQNPARLP